MIVIKIGGSIVEGLNPSILDDFKELVKNNRVAIVHGGGKDVTETANKMGKEQKFIVSPDGKRSRYTDKETAMIYSMVMSGKISKNITAMLESRGILSVGITGIDNNFGSRKSVFQHWAFVAFGNVSKWEKRIETALTQR